MSPTAIETSSDCAADRARNPDLLSPYSAMELRCAEARRKLNSVPGDPFLFADWEQVLFLHFVIDPLLLKPHVPAPFELELHNGQGCLSLVCVTMRKFRPCHFDPAAFPFRFIREQRFLNLRTYVRCDGEPGALFLHGWLSKPAPLPFPSAIASLPYTFAQLRFEHAPVNGIIGGSIKRDHLELSYSASVPESDWRPADPGSIAEFVMERYSGFFARRNNPYVFRAWHPVWMQKPVDAKVLRDDLIAQHFAPWREAQFVGASLANTIERVELGKAHKIVAADVRRRTGADDLENSASSRRRLRAVEQRPKRHRTLSRMFEMP